MNNIIVRGDILEKAIRLMPDGFVIFIGKSSIDIFKSKSISVTIGEEYLKGFVEDENIYSFFFENKNELLNLLRYEFVILKAEGRKLLIEPFVMDREEKFCPF